MFELAVMVWILLQLQSPTWCYVLLAICAVIKFLNFVCNIYKAGKEA